MKTLGMFILLTVPLLLLPNGAAMAQQSNPASQAGAQGAPPQNQSPDANAQSTPAPSGGPACWQQAGIPQKAMRTRQSIMNNAKLQIQKVMDDTSLAPQQQKRQIRQIRQNAKQQIARMITPEQESSLRECQRQRKGDTARPDSSQTNPPGTQPN